MANKHRTSTNNRLKALIIQRVMPRFLDGKIKLQIDKPEVIPFARQFIKDAGFQVDENVFTYEIGRYYWVESGIFGENIHIHNSMDLLYRNRSKETIKISEINGA